MRPKLLPRDAKRKLFELAATRLKVSVDKLEAKEGTIYVKGTGDSVPIADICFTNWQITGTGNNPPYDAIRDDKTGKVIHAYAAAATIVEVEVDMETGKVEIKRVVSGHDTGKTINPVIVENQIDLGLIMANGWVLSEDFIIDSRSGVVVNPNLLDYKLTTFLDMPKGSDFEKIVVERPCAWGPHGAKGFSETAMTALAPAIANALYNATGARLYCGFLSPGNILSAVDRANKGMRN